MFMGIVFRQRLRAIGIRDRPVAPRCLWQNGHVERTIGSIRRESIDHLTVLGETHLRRVLTEYADYYNRRARISRSAKGCRSNKPS
jgi:transposase InsO family protein